MITEHIYRSSCSFSFLFGVTLFLLLVGIIFVFGVLAWATLCARLQLALLLARCGKWIQNMVEGGWAEFTSTLPVPDVVTM